MGVFQCRPSLTSDLTMSEVHSLYFILDRLQPRVIGITLKYVLINHNENVGTFRIHVNVYYLELYSAYFIKDFSWLGPNHAWGTSGAGDQTWASPIQKHMP